MDSQLVLMKRENFGQPVAVEVSGVARAESEVAQPEQNRLVSNIFHSQVTEIPSQIIQRTIVQM